jgi:hypothetical protein
MLVAIFRNVSLGLDKTFEPLTTEHQMGAPELNRLKLMIKTLFIQLDDHFTIKPLHVLL